MSDNQVFTDITTEGTKQYIRLGSYEMEGWDPYKKKAVASGKKQPLSWRILSCSADRKRALVLCRKIIVFKPYNEENEAVTWEECTLRGWLNRDFYEAAFSAEERELIIPTMISNPDNAEYGTGGGNATEDRIFLLSPDEVKEYLPGESEAVRVTYDGDVWCWWLRSPGKCSNSAAYVHGTFYGDICRIGNCVEEASGVCPAFWINLNPESGDPES